MAVMVCNLLETLVCFNISILADTKEENLVDITLNHITKFLHLNCWIITQYLLSEHQTPIVNLLQKEFINRFVIDVCLNLTPDLIKVT